MLMVFYKMIESGSYVFKMLQNLQIHEINATILDSVASQEKFTYLSADSVTNQEYNPVLPEVLHTFNPSGFFLHKLELKVGAPLMLLCNLDPIHGLYNETQLRLIRFTWQVLEYLDRDGGDNVVLIPQIALDSGLEDLPVPF